MPPVRYHAGAFPPTNLDWSKLIPLIGPASAALARYDGVLGTIPNPQLLLSPLTTQEAVLSSRIEGTITTMTEVFEFEAEGEPHDADSQKVNDIYEVLNYRAAIREGTDKLKELPLVGRVIRAAHAVLMRGVRGQSKLPGEYRRIQNFIGAPGCTEQQARFVPTDPAKLPDGMSAWEKYIHCDEQDALVQLAVSHAEFEALHPFEDGNGRVGRMLIPLFLFDRKLLVAPTFYLSAYLEARREEYYERLLAVSRDQDWTGWCVFFLRALIAQATANTRKAMEIHALYNSKKEWVAEHTRSQHAVRTLDFLFDCPIFESSSFVAQSGIPQQTARRILRVLCDDGMLRVVRKAAGRRTAILAFTELLNTAEGQDVF